MPVITPAVYFVAGAPSGGLYYELWKYDGISTSLVWNLPASNGSWISYLYYSLTQGKIYIAVMDLDQSVDATPPGTFANGANSIYVLDPLTDAVTYITSYNFVDTQPPSEFMGGDLVPAVCAYEDGGKIYWGHQSYGGTDYHLVTFDPLSLVVSLAFGPYDPTTYYNIGGGSTQYFTDIGQGFIVRVGSWLYYANGSEIFRSATGAIGTWAIVSGAGVFGSNASWVHRNDMEIGGLSPGAFDANGAYWFVGTNNTAAMVNPGPVPNQWGGIGLWNTTVFKLDPSGNITQEFQDVNVGNKAIPNPYSFYGIEPAGLVAIGNPPTFYIINDGIDKQYQYDAAGPNAPSFPYDIYFSSGQLRTSTDGVTWTFAEIPYANYLAQNYNSTSGPVAIVVFDGNIYAVGLYNDTYVDDAGMSHTTGHGSGSHLLKYDVGGAVWTTVQSFNLYQLQLTSRGPACCMAVVVPIVPPGPPIPIAPPPGPVSRVWVTVSDTQGNPLALFDDWKNLEIVHTLNSYSVCTFSIDGLDLRTAFFGVDYIIEVHRKIGTLPYVEFVGFHRDDSRTLTTEQHSIFQSVSRGLVDLIGRRHVLYQEITPFTLKQGPGETIIKQLVNENAGPLANSLLRYANGVTAGLSLEQDRGRGPVWTEQVSNDNLLDILKTIADSTGVDYDVIRVGPVAWEFRAYYPQRGNDLRQVLAFAPELGNMVAPVYSFVRASEANVVIVLGPGNNTSRQVLTRTGNDLGASPWNRLETTVSASGNSSPTVAGAQVGVYEAMIAAGDDQLKKSAAKETFEFDVLQTDIVLYGRDYRVGDVVTAQFGNIRRAEKIVGATFTVKEGVEAVKLVFSELPR